jgi:NADH:ubiquinone oxidoreductase subunit 3 (subunit A)
MYMLGFGLLATVPVLFLSKLLSPRRRHNPVKFLPMECGQMPSGEGRTHFMMQYYSYILMFVVFDVLSLFLYAWGASLFSISRAATLPIIGFLAIMFSAMAYALYLSGRKGIW